MPQATHLTHAAPTLPQLGPQSGMDALMLGDLPIPRVALAFLLAQPQTQQFCEPEAGCESETCDVFETCDALNETSIDALVARIDLRLCAQLNAILHHPKIQALEAAWRGLCALVDGIDFAQNIKVAWLHVTCDELAADFEESPELSKTGLYRLIYSSEYGVFGGKPYGAVIGQYEFGPCSQDMTLLNQIAAISAMAHAPFITNAHPAFFGGLSFADLTELKDVAAMLDGPQMARWQRFRDTECARYVGLCLPRVLLRLPYTQSHKSVAAFNFEEAVEGAPEHYLWGHASAALAGRLADCFAQFRWCPHIVGPSSGGAVTNLLAPQFAAAAVLPPKIPLQVLIGDRLEHELSQAGFIALTYRKAQGQACFLSANSAQRATVAPPGKGSQRAAIDARLATQLPYLFIMTRLAHYIKVMQREAIGRNRGRTPLQHDINQWLAQYVADMDTPTENVRAQRPLRRASVTIEDVPHQPEWYRCHLVVQPHLKYMGAAFTLSVVSRLDKV